MATRTTLALLRPLVMGDLMRQVHAHDQTLFWRDGVILASLSVFAQTIPLAEMGSLQRIGRRVSLTLRDALMRHYQNQRLAYFDQQSAGQLVTYATADVDAIADLFSSGALGAIGDLALVAGILTAMLLLDWKLALVTFVALPVIIGVSLVIRRLSRRAYRMMRDETAERNRFVFEQVAGVRVVQALVREAQMLDEFEVLGSNSKGALRRSIQLETILEAVLEFGVLLTIAVILWWSLASRHTSHVVSFGMAVTFIQYVRQFMEPTQVVAIHFGTFQTAMTGAERVFGLLDDHQPEPGAGLVAPASAASASVPSDEMLAMENVSFGYTRDREVLRDVSLTVRRNETVAVVGLSGAGKSTMTNLLLRFYDADGGTIRIMGRPVAEYSLDELRAQFSVVNQDVHFFPGTILENITLGASEVDRERAIEAIEAVGATALVERDPRGLDATIGPTARGYSAGERQLLAFARAVYRDAPLLLLDEPTSFVDSATEAKLQRAVTEILRDRTSIVIAHRLSTIEHADRIFVLHQGMIAEAGTHAELLEQRGLYTTFWRLQSLEEARTKDRGLEASGG